MLCVLNSTKGMECRKPRYLHKIDMVVPCGECEFCCATKRSDWALRLHWEAKLHSVKQFITLTYADNHLVWKNGTSQLCKEHLQKWFRAVRIRGYKIRYFAVGEYGSTTYRPHYHIILFGDVPREVLQSAWPYGHIHVGTVTDASIMYCLGYLINGRTWKMRNGRERPFSLMSRRPGIGSNYLSPEMVAWHRSGRKNYVQFYEQRRHLPRYYKTKIFSKIDLVRIAVRDQKEMFKRAVAWLRSKPMRRMRDPVAYREEQLKQAAQRIRFKSKEHLTI